MTMMLSGCGTTWSDLNPGTWFDSGERARPLEPQAPLASKPREWRDAAGLVGLARELGIDERASTQDRVQAAAAVERALDVSAQVGQPEPWAGDKHSGTVTLVRTGRIPDTGEVCRELEAATQNGAGPLVYRSVVTCARDGAWTLVSQQ